MTGFDYLGAEPQENKTPSFRPLVNFLLGIVGGVAGVFFVKSLLERRQLTKMNRPVVRHLPGPEKRTYRPIGRAPARRVPAAFDDYPTWRDDSFENASTWEPA